MSEVTMTYDRCALAGQMAEHSFVLDLFVSFCIKAKRKQVVYDKERAIIILSCKAHLISALTLLTY